MMIIDACNIAILMKDVVLPGIHFPVQWQKESWRCSSIHSARTRKLAACDNPFLFGSIREPDKNDYATSLETYDLQEYRSDSLSSRMDRLSPFLSRFSLTIPMSFVASWTSE
jgi:hypothetical protein